MREPNSNPSPSPDPDQDRADRAQWTIRTGLLAVAAIGAMMALATEVRRTYATVPAFASPLYPEEYATPAILVWIVLGSLAAWAWREASFDRLAAQVAFTALIVLAWTLVRGSWTFRMFGPLAGFGLLVVAPLICRRYGRGSRLAGRIDRAALLLIDCAVTAMLVLLFADFLPGR